MKKGGKKDTGSGANWMDTYGDLVTLLLCFFVLLYAFSSVDEAKWERLVEVFTGSPPATAGVVEPIDPSMPIAGLSEEDLTFVMLTPPNVHEEDEEQADDMPSDDGYGELQSWIDELLERMQVYIDANNLEGVLMVEEIDQKIYIDVLEGILFESGYADILPEGQEYLMDIGTLLYQSVDGIAKINIIGHTDNVPVQSGRFVDNWELGYARSNEVMRFLFENSYLDQALFEASTRGEFEPADTNDTEEGKARNRRVQFIIESSIEDVFGS